MLKQMVLGSLLVSAVGCGSIETELDKIPVAGKDYAGPQTEMPGQTLAVGIVWYGIYGAKSDWAKPPAIKWRTHDTCTYNGTVYPGTFSEDGICNYGTYNATYDYIEVEWSGCFSCQEAFAHELAHAFYDYSVGDGGDGDHTSKFFNGSHNNIGWKYDAPNSGVGSLVEAADMALVAAGL